MPGTTIVSSVGSSMSAATGHPGQGHLQYAANNGLWWLLYLSSTQTLASQFSSAFSSWSAGSTLSLANVHNSEGRNFGFGIGNIASTDVLHMISAYPVSAGTYHTRFTLGASSWSVTNAETKISASGTFGMQTTPAGCTTMLNSANKPFDVAQDSSGNSFQAISTNADPGNSSWTVAWGTTTDTLTSSSELTSSAQASLGSGSMLYVSDNGPSTVNDFTQLLWTKYNGTSWSSSANVLSSTVTATSANNWGMVGLSTTDIHVVALTNNSNTLVHRRFNGTSWSNGNTIGNLTLATNSGLFLATDGTSVWLFAFDSSKNLQVNKWTSAGGWGGWSVVLTETNTPSYVTGYQSVVSGNIGLVWTSSTGTNFNIVGTLYPTAGGGGGGGNLFRPPLLNGLSTGGPFFANPIGRHQIPDLVAHRGLWLPRRLRKGA